MIKENELTGTEYNYILGNEYVIFSNGVTMSVEEFKTFHTKGILVEKIRSLARVPKRLSAYQVALNTGELTPLYMPVKPRPLNPGATRAKSSRKQKEIIVMPDEIREVISTTEQDKKKSFIPKSKSQVILFCMIFIAVGSAFMSVYHAATFLIQNGKPFIIASLTAIFIVMFASLGFTAARYFSEKRGFAKIFSIPFVFITCVLICYIAFSTTSVSFEQFKNAETDKTANIQKEIGSLELYTEVQKNVSETEKYIRTLEKNNTDKMTKEAFARQQRMLSSERDKLQKLREKAYELKEKSGGGSIADKKESITSVYDFLMELFGVNSRILRFVIYVIPAVFYDIVAPFGFTVVFFLTDNDLKEKNNAS